MVGNVGPEPEGVGRGGEEVDDVDVGVEGVGGERELGRCLNVRRYCEEAMCGEGKGLDSEAGQGILGVWLT